MKILLLEDDIILSEIIQEYLNELNYDVICSFDGYDAEDLCFNEKFDLFLFDVNVPNQNGFELMKSIRKNNIKTPAIFITSLHTSHDLEDGFNSGADDYIKKPFELSELNLRINNLKRLYNIERNHKINISKDIIFDTSTNQITNNGTIYKLTKKESEVLKYLINNKDKAVSIDELSINIWGYDDSPSGATIRTYIKNIRKYISNKYISNIKGVGYKFNQI